MTTSLLAAAGAVTLTVAPIAWFMCYRKGTAHGALKAARAWGDAFYGTVLAKYAEWPPRPEDGRQ